MPFPIKGNKQSRRLAGRVQRKRDTLQVPLYDWRINGPTEKVVQPKNMEVKEPMVDQEMDIVNDMEIPKPIQNSTLKSPAMLKGETNIAESNKESKDNIMENGNKPTNKNFNSEDDVNNIPPNKENQNIPYDRKQTEFYESESISGNYIVSISLKNHTVSKSKKYNLIKIYRFITCEGINPVSIRMTGFSRAEMTTKNMNDANKLLKKGSIEDSIMYTSIPHRTKYRKGVITE